MLIREVEDEEIGLADYSWIGQIQIAAGQGHDAMPKWTKVVTRGRSEERGEEVTTTTTTIQHRGRWALLLTDRCVGPMGSVHNINHTPSRGIHGLTSTSGGTTSL